MAGGGYVQRNPKWGELDSLSARDFLSARVSATAPSSHTLHHHRNPMVLLIATDRILAALEAVPAPRREELDLPSSLDLHGPIAHNQLLRLSKHLQNDAEYNSTDHGRSMNSPTILSALLRGTKVYVPPPPKKPEPVRDVIPTPDTFYLRDP